MPRPNTRQIDLSWMWVHTVSIERYDGRSAAGGGVRYAAAVPVSGFYLDEDKLVAGPDGEQIAASGVFSFAIDTAPVPLTSRITLPAEFGNRVVTVVSSSILNSGALPIPNYQEVGVI